MILYRLILPPVFGHPVAIRFAQLRTHEVMMHIHKGCIAVTEEVNELTAVQAAITTIV